MLSEGIVIEPIRFGASGTHFKVTYPDNSSQVMTWPTVGRLAYDQVATAACMLWRAQQGRAVAIAPRAGATPLEQNLARQRQEDLETLVARVSLAQALLDDACSEDARKKARRSLRQALADIGSYVIEQGPAIAIQE